MDDGEGDFAQDGGGPAAVELAPEAGVADGSAECEDGGEGAQGGGVLGGLGALFDDFRGDADGAGCDLPQRCGGHVLQRFYPSPASGIEIPSSTGDPV